MSRRWLFLFLGLGLFIGTPEKAGAQWLRTIVRSHVESLAVSGNALYAGTSGSETGGWVITSADGGASWRTLDSEGWPRSKRGLPKIFIVIDLEASGSTICAGTNDGLYISRDGGASWAPPAGAMAGQTIYAIAVSQDRIIAGGQRGVLVSDDGGASWMRPDAGMPPDAYVESLAAGRSALFAGTMSGIFVSRDNGRNWTAANTGLPEKRNIAYLAAGGKSVFASIEGGIYRSDDGGASWVLAAQGLPQGAGASCLTVNGPTIYAGFSTKGVFASSDDGRTWQALNAGMAPDKISVRLLAANDRQLTAYVFNSNITDFEFWRWPLSEDAKASPEAAQTYFQNGQRAYRENDFPSALLMFGKAIEQDPRFVDAWTQRTWSYLKLGGTANYDNALVDAAKVMALDPANKAIYFARGEVYRNKAGLSLKANNRTEADDLLGKALADYEIALAANPSSPVIPLSIGHAHLAKGDLDRALTSYSGLYDKKPTDREIEAALKRLFEEYGRQNRDIDCGSSAQAWYMAGQFYYEKTRNDQAVRCFSRALDLGLNNSLIFFFRSQAHARLGDFDRAIADADTYIDRYPREGSYESRAEIYGKHGDYDKAILDISQAIRLQKKQYNDPSPDDEVGYLYRLYWRRGDFYFLRKDWDKAIEDYRLIDGKLRPGTQKQVICLQIADAYRNKGDAKNAQRYMELYKTVGAPKK